MLISTPRSNLIVRFLSVFLLCWTSGFAATDQTGKQKITVIANDVALEVVFKQIEKQTGLRFMYAVDAVDVKEKVTVVYEKVMLNEVLEGLLGKEDVEWIYREKVISLKKKDSPPTRITGRIIDMKGDPIPGATIVIKGSRKGTKSDGEGQFFLDNVSFNTVLQVSSIGFQTRDIKIDMKVLLVQMESIISSLDTKVIVGYGTTTPRFNVGNVTSIKAEEIEKQPVSDPILALQGRVPGMVIEQTTGLSGGQVNIQIRGRNSIKSGTKPLFIVDGVPYESSIAAAPLAGYGAIGSVVSALNFLNPADIESIDVLKDADASAIYGSRGGNGVVLITTKKGKVGASRITINVNRGWQDVAHKQKLLNTQEYLQLRHEAFNNDKEIPTVDNAPDLLLWDTTKYTDWQNVFIGSTASYTDAQASVSGGSNVVQYLIGGNYHKETTIFPGNFYSQRGGGHFSIAGNSNDQCFKTLLTGSYIIGGSNLPGIDFANSINLSPNAPSIFNADGTLNWANSTWTNPYAQLISNVADAKTNNMVTNVEVSYRIISDLLFKVNIGYNEIRSNIFSGVTIAGVDPRFRSSARASAIYSNSRRNSWISEPQISYKKNWGGHSLNFLLGATLLSNKEESQSVRTSGILQDALIRNPASASSYLVRGSGSLYRYIAFFGRSEYNLYNKYLLNATIRRDGSSRFGRRKQFSNFGSIGAGWIFSEESFIKDNIPLISFGKLRGSYGITGNDQIGDYQYLDQYKFVEQAYQQVKGLAIVGLFNPDFAWERTKKSELGLELGFLKDKFLFSFSYYRTFSDNQLLTFPLPSTTGSSGVNGNLPASLTNKGLEFMLNSKNVTSAVFEWSTSLNISFNRNMLVSNAGQQIGLGIREGESLTKKFLYKQVGFDQVTGIFQFADVSGKPVPAYAADGFSTSIEIAPTYLGGLQNSFHYKNMRLDIFFQFVKKNGARGLFHADWIPGRMRNQSTAILDRWREVGDLASFQRASQTYILNTDYQAWLSSNSNYGDASYVRCKNISVTWDIPQNTKWNVLKCNMSIYLQSQNLFTLTNYKGWDPETQSVSVIPPLRVISAGVRATF